MGKIIDYGYKGFTGAYRLISSKSPGIASKVKSFFASSPSQKQAVVGALGAWSGRMPNAAQVAQYVKANPLNSLVLLITTAETADFALDLINSDPELEQAFQVLSLSDSAKTVSLPTGEYEQVQTAKFESLAKTREAIRALSASELLRFKDEIEVIQKVEAMLPGNTRQARRELLELLIKVVKMDQSVHFAREVLEELGA